MPPTLVIRGAPTYETLSKERVAHGRFEVQIIGRGSGRSIFAAAAYRCGEVITDPHSGRAFDYRSRHGVRAHEILVPPQTPPIENSQSLWTAADACETRVDAQLAREMLGSMPHQLSLDEQREAVREFYDEQLAPHGIVLDVSYHGPDRRGDVRNVHAHMLGALRPYGPDGRFGSKAALRHLNSRANLQLWREAFERCVNRALTRAMINDRVVLRKHSLFPEPQQGPFATELERRGERTFAGDERRRVRNERESFDRETRPPPAPRRDVLDAAKAILTQVAAAVPASKQRELRVEHPGRDRWHEFTHHDQRYREAIARSSLASWRTTATEAGIMFSFGKKRIEDRGGKIVVDDEKSVDPEAIIDLCAAKGWKEIRLTGSPRYKAMVALAAIDRGIAIVADDKDKPLLREVHRLHAQQQAAKNVGERAKSAGSDLHAPSPGGAAVLTEQSVDAIAAEALVLLTQQTSTFSRRDVVKLCERLGPDDVARAELAAAILAHPEVQQVGADHMGSPRYTTSEMVAIERRTIEMLLEMSSTQGRFGVSPTFRDGVAEKKTFEPEQSAALNNITDATRVGVILGRAGTGKSYLMGGARESWHHAQLRVRGCALSGKAADGLQADAGIESSTIASLLLRLEPREGRENDKASDPLDNKTVLVIDEIGMVGSRDFHRLVRLAHDAGAKIVMLGDPEQLQPIAAGAPFRALLDRLPPEKVSHLHDIRRQKTDWMREATNAFASDRTADGLELYDAHGLLHQAATRDAAKDALVEKWRADRVDDPTRSQIVLAYTRDDVRSLNDRIRTLRRAAGELGEDTMIQTDGGERAFAASDRIYFLENNRDLRVKNGTLGTIVKINGARLTVKADGRDGLVVVDTKEYNKLDHGYAATVHKSQGVTVDLAYFLATAHRGMDRHLAYVAASRHRFNLDIYWSTDQFRTRRQVDRVLGRDGRKDHSMDYSVGDGVGYGVPQQSRDGVALRAPYQIRIELQNVLRTAKDLRDSAAPDHVHAARRAYAAVWSWYNGVDAQLRDLEARGVRGVAITGSAENFAERMKLVETSVQTSLSRTIELARGSAQERLGELRRDAARLERSLDEKIAEAHTRLKREAPELLVPPEKAVTDELHRYEEAVTRAGNDQERATARRALEDAKVRFARPEVLDALTVAFHDRVAAYGDDRRERAATTALLDVYGAHKSELRDLAIEINSLLEINEPSLEQLEKVADRYRDTEQEIGAR